MTTLFDWLAGDVDGDAIVPAGSFCSRSPANSYPGFDNIVLSCVPSVELDVSGIENEERVSALSMAMDGLNERERKVLELRFGLRDGRARLLEEIGQELGVTRERIRQIEAKAIRKLRHPSRSRGLRELL